MLLSDFDYHLPPERIAQTPAEPRDSARLLCLDKNTGELKDKIFSDIADMLGENDVLVVNETRVIKARLKGYIGEKKCSLISSPREKIVGGQKGEHMKLGKPCEIFLHKQISDNTWDCLVYPGKKLKPGTEVVFYRDNLQPHFSCKDKGEKERSDYLEVKAKQKIEGVEPGEKVLSATILSTSQKGRIVEFSKGGQEFLDIIDSIGETPLPPYIKNSDSKSERYQTVYNDKEKYGSVAAPTAGLHFTPELFHTLERKGVKIEKICLHVGLGTFANVEVENIQDHHMHTESAYINVKVAGRLNQYKSEGKRIIAVGTTSVRTLESFTDKNGQLGHGQIDTDIFIYPGYEWKFVESIITNFHLPKSTLVMLVSSFADSENIKKAYQHAVDSEYRFFSFGDAMWIQ